MCEGGRDAAVSHSLLAAATATYRSSRTLLRILNPDPSSTNIRMGETERFEFAFAASYGRFQRLLTITPDRAWVEVGPELLRAKFGFYGLETPLANVARAEVTGPYAYWKTAGPARLGVTDSGLTFATNGERGVLITFREPVRSRGPLGMLRHPELTVTVADAGGLSALLNERAG